MAYYLYGIVICSLIIAIVRSIVVAVKLATTEQNEKSPSHPEQG